MAETRIEKDSMGEVRVPAEAFYGAQTQRAVENFPISGIRFPRAMIRALALIKAAAARVNEKLGLFSADTAAAIGQAAEEVAAGRWDDHFPLDIYQTGSGTSTNMNANEVIATRATQILGGHFGAPLVHPNDQVNMGQSSNDAIPAAIHISAYLEVHETLLPGLERLHEALRTREGQTQDVIKTGRTHLMDAMPIRLGQEIGAWAYQVGQGIERINGALPRLARLALGGTAVGSGINTHPEFGRRVAAELARITGLPFVEAENHFAAQAAMDTAVELSGQLKTLATALMKIANDLRWMNSGPIAGLGEIALPGLQPGSSIMPGKVNPVIGEAMMMVCAQVLGNDLAVAIGNQMGNFQLNVMLPLIARNLLESITLLGNATRVMAEKAIDGFTVNQTRMAELIEMNPILVTTLNPVIGYDKAAQIAKRAYAEGRRVKEVAREMTELGEEELAALLDPRQMTEGGIMQAGPEGPGR